MDDNQDDDASETEEAVVNEPDESAPLELQLAKETLEETTTTLALNQSLELNASSTPPAEVSAAKELSPNLRTEVHPATFALDTSATFVRV